LGTVSLVRITDETVKFRKMYVDENYHGRGYGYYLLKTAVDTAISLNYHEIALETVHTMHEAHMTLKKNYKSFKHIWIHDKNRN